MEETLFEISRNKQIVNKFEEEKLNFDTLLKLSDIDSDRILPVFKTSEIPEICASIIRKLIYPSENGTPKQFLKNLISKLAENNVLVFEFVESYNKKDKANIEGFYLNPNVIVLKWQKYTRREIFTLAHEIAHYLLKEEDIDEKINSETLYENLNDIEKWCNKFAFSFLSGSYELQLNDLEVASINNDFHNDFINHISKNTYLSTLSLYTHLYFIGKISKNDYNTISENTSIAIKKAENEEKIKQELKKIQNQIDGKKTFGAPIKAILSPFYIQTLQTALYNGIVDEYEFCKKLNIKPNKIEDYLV